MEVNLIYHTPNYHKLVEAVARLCYQSYDKVSPTSHNIVRGILKKGHLSIASVGNIVFTVDVYPSDDYVKILEDLMTFKEINNFIRWTIDKSEEHRVRIIVSMNLLTLKDLLDSTTSGKVNGKLIEEIQHKATYCGDIHFFFGEDVRPVEIDNPYLAPYIDLPKLGEPVILSEDYARLKELGLTKEELEIHSTTTIDFITDRASGLQAWRHTDMTGGTELSQRYVDKTNAESRKVVLGEGEEVIQGHLRAAFAYSKSTYQSIMDICKDVGVSPNRAKELARCVLPNMTTTRIIQCRPLRQWKHFFKLRVASEAQAEIRQDALAMLAILEGGGLHEK